MSMIYADFQRFQLKISVLTHAGQLRARDEIDVIVGGTVGFFLAGRQKSTSPKGVWGKFLSSKRGSKGLLGCILKIETSYAAVSRKNAV